MLMQNVQQISVKALIKKKGKVLMLQDEKGSWELPGGRVEFGEDPIITMRRELKEEMSVEVRSIGNIVGVKTFMVEKSDVKKQIVLIVFSCEIGGESIILDHESQRYAWISPSDVSGYPMKDVYKDLLRES